MVTRLLQIQRPSPTWGPRPVGRSSGFTVFWFLAAVVFLVTFAGVLTMKYQAANGTSPTFAATDSSQQKIEIPLADPANTTPAATRLAEQAGTSDERSSIKFLLAGFFGDTDEPVTAGAQGAESASNAQHAEWVDRLYVQLNSLEPAGAEDTAPVISGRVLTRTGQPVSGVKVSAQLREYFKTGDSETAKAAPQTTTNSNGFYAFRDLPEGIYMISTRASGSYAPARTEVRTGVKYADLVLESLGVAQVSGLVTDIMGMELAGVRIMPLVKGIPEGAVSNNHGEFEFDLALQGETRSFPVRFQLEDYREVRHQVAESDWSEDGRLTFTVEMEPVYEFSTVSGSITDAASVQIAGETVQLYSSSLKRNYRAQVNGGGFHFKKVEIADDYQLWVHPTGPYRDYAEQNVALTVGGLWRDIELESLNRDYRLQGRILDQRGKPLPGFTLTLRSKAASGQKLEVKSDAYGHYEVDNIPEGELVFESRTTPNYKVSGVQLSGNDTDRDLDLVVNRGKHKLLGTVVDSNGRPIASPKIFITASTTVNGLRSQSSSTTSADYEGRFLFTELGAGQHTVTVNAPGYEGVRLQPVVGMQNELVVRLEKNLI